MRERELRIALVCFGGVSLAIYIHGICKEILKLLRASSALHRITDRSRRAGAAFFDQADSNDPEYDTEADYFELLISARSPIQIRQQVSPMNIKVLTNQMTMRIVSRLRHGPLGFAALERAVEPPNPPILSKHLKKLVRDGLVVRHVITLGPPARTLYELTAVGHDLAKPAGAMLDWIERNLPAIETARERSRIAAEVDHAMAARNGADAAA